MNGNLNNTYAARHIVTLDADSAYSSRSFAIPSTEDEPRLELSTVLKMVDAEIFAKGEERLRVLVLYGSMRTRYGPYPAISRGSYSKLLAYEAARVLFRLGCDVRVFDPSGLPIKDDIQHSHAKVQELRDPSKWSDGHVWTAVFKNQIDWIPLVGVSPTPLSTGSVRPTQGRTLAIAQVCGGSQSFNCVNSLRILGRWMRMFTIPNQSSVPKAYTQFTEPDAREGGSRLMPGSNRDRLVDCMEEFVKYTIVMRPHFHLFGDRFSEREERSSSHSLFK
ncbi:arsenate resistance ArsH [Zopfia rhizophila CBS 207.26]|uniref:Arsenate resistance ArsH n=1 Tax=Zopfia rhizophila CBS 207.26 TaxID=1314779 RepID=A0A6A6EDD6_9PEZI|nr:arsenate resistance ArsH [Zopfia rhizophila CBS 207.26]